MTDTSPPMYPALSPSQSVELSVQEIGWAARAASDAAAALEAAAYGNVTGEEAISDLVVHMRHLADREGIRWSTITGWAEIHYYNNTRGEATSTIVPPSRSITHLGLPVHPGCGMPDLVTYAADEPQVRSQNKTRAATAAAAALTFCSDGDWETGMIDLLTGLRHLADHVPGVHWSEIEATAEMHYHAELRGEG